MRRTLCIIVLVTVCSLPVLVSAQNSQITINDSSGNTTVGTLNNGNLFFHDNNGNVAFGTVRDGTVFLSTSSGEVIFGTIESGNVFLTDQKGVTTGTIQNGNILLNNSDGTQTTGSYNASGAYTTTTPHPDSGVPHAPANSDQTQREQRNDNYYQMGEGLGAGIVGITSAMVQRHRMKAFCRDHPTSRYVTSNGVLTAVTLCPGASYTQSEQGSVDKACLDNPGGEVFYEGRWSKCVKPPTEPNLKWAKWEMNNWHGWYEWHTKKKHSSEAIQAFLAWNRWKGIFCSLADSASTYKALDGKKEPCK